MPTFVNFGKFMLERREEGAHVELVSAVVSALVKSGGRLKTEEAFLLHGAAAEPASIRRVPVRATGGGTCNPPIK